MAPPRPLTVQPLSYGSLIVIGMMKGYRHSMRCHKNEDRGNDKLKNRLYDPFVFWNYEQLNSKIVLIQERG